MNRNRVVGVAAWTLAAAVVAGPAAAEGQFTSFWSNWAVGKNSRQWLDLNLDGVVTNIFVKGCTFNWPNGTEVALRVMRVDTFTPDENMGTRDIPNCEAGQTVSWADFARDDYYFKLAEINDNSVTTFERSNASTVTVKW